MKKILDFSAKQVGATGVCKGLRADWNDCLNLGGGESALVSFLHYWALCNFIDLASFLGRKEDVATYTQMAERVKEVCNNCLLYTSTVRRFGRLLLPVVLLAFRRRFGLGVRCRRSGLLPSRRF